MEVVRQLAQVISQQMRFVRASAAVSTTSGSAPAWPSRPPLGPNSFRRSGCFQGGAARAVARVKPFSSSCRNGLCTRALGLDIKHRVVIRPVTWPRSRSKSMCCSHLRSIGRSARRRCRPRQRKSAQRHELTGARGHLRLRRRDTESRTAPAAIISAGSSPSAASAAFTRGKIAVVIGAPDVDHALGCRAPVCPCGMGCRARSTSSGRSRAPLTRSFSSP